MKHSRFFVNIWSQSVSKKFYTKCGDFVLVFSSYAQCGQTFNDDCSEFLNSSFLIRLTVVTPAIPYDMAPMGPKILGLGSDPQHWNSSRANNSAVVTAVSAHILTSKQPAPLPPPLSILNLTTVTLSITYFHTVNLTCSNRFKTLGTRLYDACLVAGSGNL